MQPLDPRVVEVPGAPPWLQQEERVGIQRRRIEVIGKPLSHQSHRFGVGFVLIDPVVGIVVFPHTGTDIALMNACSAGVAWSDARVRAL